MVIFNPMYFPDSTIKMGCGVAKIYRKCGMVEHIAFSIYELGSERNPGILKWKLEKLILKITNFSQFML